MKRTNGIEFTRKHSLPILQGNCINILWKWHGQSIIFTFKGTKKGNYFKGIYVVICTSLGIFRVVKKNWHQVVNDTMRNDKMTRSKPGGKILWSRVISVAMAIPDLRHCAHYDTHIMRVSEGEMHGANGNVNTENCIHVIGWLIYFCMYACWRPIHIHVQIPTIVYVCTKTSGGSKIFQRGRRQHQRWCANQFWPFSRKLHEIKRKKLDEARCVHP